ncbi:MAG: hypothetical protein EOP87_10885 [Verrucomicrobiaceae bacterium]|nr:MAG: hypothetical protein EOP87_10885 [Verrucomicrobiaceae bacterium]
MLVFLDMTAAEPDAMLRASGVDRCCDGEGQHRKPAIGHQSLPLDFREIRPLDGCGALETLTSAGVWAKNSARDIFWEEASRLAERIASEIFW